MRTTGSKIYLDKETQYVLFCDAATFRLRTALIEELPLDASLFEAPASFGLRWGGMADEKPVQANGQSGSFVSDLPVDSARMARGGGFGPMMRIRPRRRSPAASSTTVTYIRWGKSELFPVLAMVGPGTELDIYEYDQTWVLVLYETMVTQGSQAYAHAFYGYMKRSDITCDPDLEGEASDKANTGPGKRKGRKPRTNTETSAGTGETQPTASGPSDQNGRGQNRKQTVERDDEGYDWIIRTPGLCNVTIQVDEAVFYLQFRPDGAESRRSRA